MATDDKIEITQYLDFFFSYNALIVHKYFFFRNQNCSIMSIVKYKNKIIWLFVPYLLIAIKFDISKFYSAELCNSIFLVQNFLLNPSRE